MANQSTVEYVVASLADTPDGDEWVELAMEPFATLRDAVREARRMARSSLRPWQNRQRTYRVVKVTRTPLKPRFRTKATDR